jgi:hypothetical protein
MDYLGNLRPVMVHVPAQELHPLAGIQRARDEVWRDDRLKIEPIERLPQRIEYWLTGGERRDPVRQRPIRLRGGIRGCILPLAPGRRDDFLDRAPAMHCLALPNRRVVAYAVRCLPHTDDAAVLRQDEMLDDLRY